MHVCTTKMRSQIGTTSQHRTHDDTKKLLW